MAVQASLLVPQQLGRRHESVAGVQVVPGVLEQPGLWGELNVPRGGRSTEDPICPSFAPVEGEEEALI